MYTLQLIYNTIYNRFVFLLLTKNYLFLTIKTLRWKHFYSLNYTSVEVSKDFYEASSSECNSIFQEIVLNTYRYPRIGELTSLLLDFILLNKCSGKENSCDSRNTVVESTSWRGRLSFQPWVSRWGVPRLETKPILDATVQEFGSKMRRWIWNRNNTT